MTSGDCSVCCRHTLPFVLAKVNRVHYGLLRQKAHGRQSQRNLIPRHPSVFR